MKVIFGLLAFGLGACTAVDTGPGFPLFEGNAEFAKQTALAKSIIANYEGEMRELVIKHIGFDPHRQVQQVEKSENTNDSRKLTENLGNCGPFCDARAYQTEGLRLCLVNNFSTDRTFLNRDKTTVRGEEDFPKVVFEDDGNFYTAARRQATGIRLPIGIVYADDEEDVQVAVKCAYDNGYKISVRGRSHNYNNLGGMDGYLVIDMANVCSEDSVVVDKSQTGEHLVPGSRYIGTLKHGAGCASAFVIGMLDKLFESSDAVLAISGTCTSIGVVGMAIGGGQGDATPYLGLTADLVTQMELIDWKGNKLVASEDENPDLFWALRGGGSALGVVTSITYKVVQSPTPSAGFSTFALEGSAGNSDGIAELVYQLQEFLTNGPIEVTSKFGGGGQTTGPSSGSMVSLRIQYLGSMDDARKDVAEYLRNFTMTPIYEAVDFPELTANYWCSNVLSGDGPLFPFGLYIHWVNPKLHGGKVNMCTELDIDESYCKEYQFGGYGEAINLLLPASCGNENVLKAILSSAQDNQSFLNSFGPSRDVHEKYNSAGPLADYDYFTFGDHAFPGVSLPQIDLDTWKKITKATEESGILFSNHLNHAAPTLVRSDETAYAHRSSWTLSGESFLSEEIIEILLEDMVIEDTTDLMGYWNIQGAVDQPGWERVYFADNYERLQEIKLQYDPTGTFSKPMSPALPTTELIDDVNGGDGYPPLVPYVRDPSRESANKIMGCTAEEIVFYSQLVVMNFDKLSLASKEFALLPGNGPDYQDYYDFLMEHATADFTVCYFGYARPFGNNMLSLLPGYPCTLLYNSRNVILNGIRAIGIGGFYQGGFGGAGWTSHHGISITVEECDADGNAIAKFTTDEKMLNLGDVFPNDGVLFDNQVTLNRGEITFEGGKIVKLEGDSESWSTTHFFN